MPHCSNTKKDHSLGRLPKLGIDALWEKHYPGRVRFVHGKIPEADKIAALEALRTRQADILISTTVVEIGIDLSELKHVVIVHAERFGLTALHQLRGRVARTGGFGRCDLFLPRAIAPLSMQRLSVMCRLDDGFEIARQDMHLPGSGDLSSNSDQQTGRDSSLLPGRGVSIATLEMLVEAGLVEVLRNMRTSSRHSSSSG